MNNTSLGEYSMRNYKIQLYVYRYMDNNYKRT